MAKACRALALGRAALSHSQLQLRFHPFSSDSTPENPDASPPNPQTGEYQSFLGGSPHEGLRATFRGQKQDGDGNSSSGGGGEQASGRMWERDSGFEDIFSASRASSESALWNSFLNKPKEEKGKDEGNTWDFLKRLKADAPRSTGQSSSDSPVRKFRDTGAGFDFISEAIDLPAKDTGGGTERDAGEESILHNASFSLLRESFRQASMQSDREGVSSEAWKEAASLNTWTKAVDSRSLAEVEGNFYTVQDRAPTKEEKEWTYEELGEKLRQVRPPKEQQLTSAMGLSFKELGDRLQKMEELDKVKPKLDALVDYRELQDSLEELRPSASPKSVSSAKHLSIQELQWLTTMGTSVNIHPKIEYIPPNDDLLKKYFAREQMSSKELLKLEIQKLKKEFQMHDSDSGSSQVQIAILTAKINNLNRHLREGPNYKRDKHSRKGLNDMVQYRKRLLRYLRRRDWDVYCNVLTKLGLDDVILEKRT